MGGISCKGKGARRSAAKGEATRSELTRERLIAAGLALFGSHGFEGVSTRALAARARANQAAIPYHFDSKEGLYHAVARRIVEMVRPGVEPVLLDIQRRHQEGVTDLSVAREDAALLILTLLNKIVNQPHKYEIGHFMMREQMQPSAAFDILYESLIQPLHDTLAMLVGALRDRPRDDEEVIIEAHTLFGQAVIFGVHRTTLLRRPDLDSLDQQHLTTVTAVARPLVYRPFPLQGLHAV